MGSMGFIETLNFSLCSIEDISSKIGLKWENV